MTTHFTQLAERVAADGVVTPEEVLSLRREGWGDGIITREEAEAIFAINNALTARDDEWCNFFVEAIGEFVLNGTEPRLQCSREEAEWLIAQVDHDGVIESLTELECLVRIVERAENVPEVLKNYVLEQVEREVMTGTGPTRCGGELAATHITAAECRILRRVIFASGGYGPAAVTRFDAELLFRIKDATLEDENAEEWGDLFVDGVANFLRGFALDNAQLSDERKLELEAFLADTKSNVGGFLRRAVSQKPEVAEGLDSIGGVVSTLLTGKSRGGPVAEHGGKRIVAQAAQGAEFTESEEAWLSTAIEADGQIDELEKRAIRRLAELDDA